MMKSSTRTLKNVAKIGGGELKRTGPFVTASSYFDYNCNPIPIERKTPTKASEVNRSNDRFERKVDRKLSKSMIQSKTGTKRSATTKIVSIEDKKNYNTFTEISKFSASSITSELFANNLRDYSILYENKNGDLPTSSIENNLTNFM